MYDRDIISNSKKLKIYNIIIKLTN